MQNSTTSLARGQWATCSYQKIALRPGVGVRVYTINPAARLTQREQPAHLAGTTRGKVVGFSSASAQRLRRLLFTLDYPHGECFGMAFTSAPWVKRKPEEAFRDLTRDAPRCKGLRAAVWRKEVTKKGLSHYHAIVWLKSPDDAFAVWSWLGRNWVKHLLRDGVCPGVAFLTGSKAFKRNGMVPTDNPDSWRWFGEQAMLGVNLRFRRGGKDSNFVDMTHASAVQYLCDHTSKHKEYQAKTTGRAWGFWNRALLPFLDLPGISLADCPLRLLADIRKALAKMSRYWWADKQAPFGYRWSHPRSFRSGDKVLFRPNAPEVVSRLIEAHSKAVEAGAASDCAFPRGNRTAAARPPAERGRGGEGAPPRRQAERERKAEVG